MSELFLPVRFYPNELYASPYKPECQGYNHGEYFRTSSDYILPFQILDMERAINVNTFFLLDCHGDETPIDIPANQTTVQRDGQTMDYVTHYGSIIPQVPSGVYQIGVESTHETFFSDPLYFEDIVVAGEEGYYDPRNIEIRYRSSRHGTHFLGDIYFPVGWWGMCYVGAFIEKPRYPILNETRQDGEMNEHQLFQRWEKRRRMAFKGIESMADALTLLPLMEVVMIQGQEVFDVVVNVTWDDDYSCLCNIELSFLTTKAIRSF